MITNKDEAKTMIEQFSSDCKCKFNNTTCNWRQKWNNKTCWRECKSLKKIMIEILADVFFLK